MKRLQHLFILIGLLLLLSISALAQVQTCTVSGTVYNGDGTPAAGAILDMVRVVKPGVLTSSDKVRIGPSDSSGHLTFNAPRGSQVTIKGFVVGFDSSTGTILQIP
ncbi:MAG: hypothetical protein WCB68_12210, partial [Pyrinomonadaceae bacterium]